MTIEPSRVVTDDGVTIFYGDFGRSDGRAIMLLHGLAAGGAQFTDDARYFAERGFRVLVPDLRGHGQSGKPEPIQAQGFAIPRLAADMIAVLDHAGVAEIDWVGNSLGGIVALHLLAEHPHRLRSLATFGTAHALALPLIAASAIPWGYRLLGRRLLSTLGGFGTTQNNAVRPLIAKMLYDFDPRVGWAIAENVRRYDLLANAQNHAGPMLLLRGGRDRQVNMALRKTLPRLAGKSNFTLVELPEAGHCANLDAPLAVRQALERFWMV